MALYATGGEDMILTKEEAAGVVKIDNPEDYPTLDIIIPAIEDYLLNATGKDWSTLIPPDPLAKFIASILLSRWFQDTGLIGKVEDQGLIGLIAQLRRKV